MHRDFLGQEYQVGDYVFWYKQCNGRKKPTLGQVTRFTKNSNIMLHVYMCEKRAEQGSEVRIVYPDSAIIIRDGSHQYILKEIVARK